MPTPFDKALKDLGLGTFALFSHEVQTVSSAGIVGLGPENRLSAVLRSPLTVSSFAALFRSDSQLGGPPGVALFYTSNPKATSYTFDFLISLNDQKMYKFKLTNAPDGTTPLEQNLTFQGPTSSPLLVQVPSFKPTAAGHVVLSQENATSDAAAWFWYMSHSIASIPKF
jgi:hypothetical protein